MVDMHGTGAMASDGPLSDEPLSVEPLSEPEPLPLEPLPGPELLPPDEASAPFDPSGAVPGLLAQPREKTRLARPLLSPG